MLRSAKKVNNANGEPAAQDDILKWLRQGGRRFLLNLKQKSIRSNNAWYRVLNFEKRRLIDAVIQTVNKIKSSLLLKILAPLAEKLLQAIGGMRGLMGHLAFGMQSFGRPLAEKISTLARKWGNKQAAEWANDEGFIRFLTVIDMNDLPIFRVSNQT